MDKRLRRLDHAIRDMLKNLNSSDPAMEHYVRILAERYDVTEDEIREAWRLTGWGMSDEA